MSLTIVLSAAPGGSKQFTVYKNGVATSLAVTIEADATFGQDASGTLLVSVGDTLAVQDTFDISANPAVALATIQLN